MRNMRWQTHFAGGALAGAALGAALQGSLLAAAGVGALAALVPDVDTPGSKLGSAVRPVSAAVNAVAGHRGPLHSLAAAAVFAFLVGQAWKAAGLGVLAPLAAALVALAGFLSHLALDALNPQGVPLFWPFGKRVGVPVARTGSVLEWPLAAVMFFGLVWVLARR